MSFSTLTQTEKAQLHPNELKKRELFAQAMVQFTLAAESGHRNAQHQLGIYLCKRFACKTGRALLVAENRSCVL